jgi:choline dehydrogenase-like flavoprotein
MDFDAIVVGSGFGGTVAASQLVEKGKRVLVIERGAWWVSPLGLSRPPKVPPLPMRKWLQTVRAPALQQQGRREIANLVNYWPRPDHMRGVFDLVASIRTRWNPDGLYSYRKFDQAHIPTANAVGGGSMIYSNVTIQPRPEALERIGLDLVQSDYDAALAWMEQFRGPTNEIVTKSPPLPKEERDRLGLDLENLDADHEYLYLDKSLALKTAATQAAPKLRLEMPWKPLQLSIIDYDPARPPKTTNGTVTPVPSAADKAHTYCQRQGRCLFGCIPQARHTLNKTLYGKLLVDPQFQNLIELRELAEVSSVARVDGGYEVTYRDRMKSGDEVRVRAPKVFLAAGTLGTSELLLRCAEQGSLKLSPALGQGFSSNGDFGGFAIGTTEKIHSTQGPINTCHLDIKLDDGTLVTVEDSGLPAIVAELATYTLHILQLYLQKNRRWRKWWFKFRMRLFWHVGRPLHLRSARLPHFLPRPVRMKKQADSSMRQFPWKHRTRVATTAAPQAGTSAPAAAPTAFASTDTNVAPPTATPAGTQPAGQQQWASPDIVPDTTDPLRYETEAEMVEDIFFFNTMGQDEGNGVFSLKRGFFDRLFGRPAQLDLNWDEPVERQPVFAQIDRIQQALTDAMGGTYLPMPFWGGLTKKKKLVIPHPLGGCRIATSREHGVVDARGRVYDGAGNDPTATLPGLYIVDGSVIPGALAVNPTLTITAQAVKTMSAALQD